MAKLYILVRNDLRSNYQAVQAGHAVAEFMMEYPGLWNNETLIYLKIKDEDEAKTWNVRFAEWGAAQVPFSEPDMENEITAVAVLSTPEVDMLMSKMKLV